MEPTDYEQTQFTETILSEAKILENYSEKELETIIKEQIIPAMDKRRNRNEPMSSDEIYSKINNIPNSEKPGEIHELLREMTRHPDIVSPFKKDVATALEIADVVYYTLQLNSKEDYNLFWNILLGNPSLGYIFCIIKYNTRLKYGDRENYKEIETSVMKNYLEELNSNRENKYHWFFS